MSTTASSSGQKRKAQGNSSNNAKRQKIYQARAIPTQMADAALSKAGELNIASFVKSREYEIRSLDKNIKDARKALSTRAFQQVPRHLRRRTASHNAKKVPRRLRGRARKEMLEDNTPTVNSKTRTPTSRLRLRLETAKALQKMNQKRKTVRQKKREAKTNASESDPAKHVEVVRVPRIKKNRLAGPPLATTKFKRRQVNKTWLPTHLWHTKRAHMTQPTQPLWRIAIPLRPTEKCYRATHRASESRGCIAWDMSYISTVGCLGTATALEGLLKALGFHGHSWSGAKYKKWISSSRFASGWVGSRDGKEAIAMVDVLWCAHQQEERSRTSKPECLDGDTHMVDEPAKPERRKTKLDRRLLIRTHPAAFLQVWQDLLQAAKMQKPQVLVEDLRFEIGCIEVAGPGSAEALTSVLKPLQADETTAKVWQSMSAVSNPAFLPQNVSLNFNAKDPRFVSFAKRPSISDSEADEQALHVLVADWPLDSKTSHAALFSHKARYRASRLPSQWSLNRRRQTALPGQGLKESVNDPVIPVVVLAHRPTSLSSTQQGHWSLLAPWGCIDVIWRKLLYCGLSSGSKPRFGGLREKRQVAFEQMKPWYPGDFPGTEAGKAWERSEAEKRFDAWIRHPPSRRIAWDRLDLGLNRRGEVGRGWACDWEYLFQDTSSRSHRPMPEAKQTGSTKIATKGASQLLRTQRQRKAAKATVDAEEENVFRRRNTSSPESDGAAEVAMDEEAPFLQLTPTAANLLLQQTAISYMPPQSALATVRIKLIGRGTPKDAARIYRLPTIKPTGEPRTTTSVQESKTVSSLSNETPPASQCPPSQAPANQSSSSNVEKSFGLRDRWLASDCSTAGGQTATRLKKDQPNHRGHARKAEHYPVESLRSINVLPKNAPLEIIEQYGWKPLTEEETKLQVAKDSAVHMEEQKVWDMHIPCPDAHDLIGFVTTGNYNLAEGRGTAVGALWLQRLLSGWKAEGNGQSDASTASVTKATTNKAKKAGGKTIQRSDRERHLCIVRNAGESVGRLALWELCD